MTRASGPTEDSGPEMSFGGESAASVVALTVTCPACKGDGLIVERVGFTRAPVTSDTRASTCGTCNGKGELVVRPESDPRRLFSGEDGQYVETDHPPFWINTDLYVLDTAGDTVLVEDGDVDCSICGRALVEGTRAALCPRCEGTARAHGRLEAERRRQEAEAAA